MDRKQQKAVITEPSDQRHEPTDFFLFPRTGGKP
jgi:hypothetical protein